MSIDLSVWSPVDVQLPEALPHADSWEVTGDEWAYPGEGWHVLVMLGAGERPDDVVLQKLPGAKTVIYVTLEPVGADREGRAMLEKVVRGLARLTGGVWVDLNNMPFFADEGPFWE